MLPEALRALWVWIWDTRNSVPASLNPSSLYYQLLHIGAQHDLAAGFTATRHAPTAIPRQSMQHAIDHVLRDLNARIPQGSALASALSPYAVSPVTIGTSEIEAFVGTMRIRTVASSVAKLLSSSVAGPSRLQPYPMIPSRLGLIYRALGISHATGLYWNRSNDPAAGARLALGVYVDVSASMVQHFPFVVSIVGSLQDYAIRFKVFDDTVREAEVDVLAGGTVVGGGGTNFDAAVEDFVAEQELAGALLITDGEGFVSTRIGDQLRRCGRPLYVIYVRQKATRSRRVQDSLAHYATQMLELPPLNPGDR
jgi:hypothetical protein